MNFLAKTIRKPLSSRTFSTSAIPEWKINVKGQSGSVLQMSMGVGTYHNEEATQSVLDGLKNGFRFIDNALMQRNQPAVGEALTRSGLPRD